MTDLIIQTALVHRNHFIQLVNFGSPSTAERLVRARFGRGSVRKPRGEVIYTNSFANPQDAINEAIQLIDNETEDNDE